jgi:biotin transporter BioY
MITAALIVYGIGWVVMALVGGVAWLLGLGFNQDNMSTFAVEQAKLTIAVFCLIWFWPIAVPVTILIQNREDKAIALKNALYRERMKKSGQD